MGSDRALILSQLDKDGRFFILKKRGITVIKPSYEEVLNQSRQYKKIPVYQEIYMDFQTPIGVLSLIKERYDKYFLLESVQGGERLARYTFIGFNPEASFYVKDGHAFYATREVVKKFPGNPLEVMKEIMKKYQAPQHTELPPFTGGAVGYFGYDMIGYTEQLQRCNEDVLQASDIKLMFFDSVIAFDHYKQKIYLITNIEGDKEGLEERYTNAKNELKELMLFVTKPVKRRAVPFEEHITFKSNTTKESFMERVEQAIAYIKNGDIFQMVLSQVFQTEFSSNLFDVYRVLRTINPSPYMYLMQFDDLQLAGASPETLVKLQDGTVTTMPIAGTHPRGKTEEEDKMLDEKLLTDPKELAEHNMLVDLARNDIGKISEMDSVEVAEYRVLQRFSHVTHITSRVTGKLLKGLTGVDALRAILPAGTLSGAPKIRAMEIIEELETQKRGIYGGGIGYMGYDGSLDTCIAIRTIIKKDGMAYIQAGGGIVLDSDPEKEYEESTHKATALFEAMKKVGEII